MKLSKILILAVSLALASASFAQTLISDQFSDGNSGTNTTGTGTGFNSYGTVAPSESGGFLQFSTGGGQTYVLNSKETLNPFLLGQWTTSEYKFGTIGVDTNLHRLWVGYRPSSDTSNHYLGSGAISVAIVHQDSGETEASNGFILANGATVARFNWSSLAGLDGIKVSISTMALDASTVSYQVSFSEASASLSMVSGSLSGTFTPSSTVATNWSAALHSQFSSGGAATLDSVNVAVGAIPEPSTYAAIFGASVLGLALWRRRRS